MIFNAKSSNDMTSRRVPRGDFSLRRRLEAAAKHLLPPVVTDALRGRGAGAIRFSEGYDSWREARAASEGYDSPSILEKTIQAALQVKRGEAVYERDSVLFDRIEYSWPVLAGLLWAAARSGGRLATLDFGGSLGTRYFQNRVFLRDLDVRWSIVEQPLFVEAGRRYFADNRLAFHESVAAAIAAGPPDVVLFGGSLQFLEQPFSILEELGSVPHHLLILDNTPFSDLEEDRVCVQHVSPVIYPASYPSHIFSRSKFERWIAAHGWAVMERFDAASGQFRANRGLRFAFQGMLLAR